MLLQLKEDLGKKNMLFPKSCIELSRVIGQGMYWGKPLYSLAMLVMITGESGLVYRGYVKRGQMNELVAIKTGKGTQPYIYYEDALHIMNVYITPNN